MNDIFFSKDTEDEIMVYGFENKGLDDKLCNITPFKKTDVFTNDGAAPHCVCAAFC